MIAPPIDSFHRKINYLRLSITDRCNLRCTYCMPQSGVPKLDHFDILRYEEIVRLAGIATAMGISNVRITGGEPLVRKGVLSLCESIAGSPGLSTLSLTTNGVLLSEFASGLFRAGVKRVNVSLDTLKPERFLAITGKDYFGLVWEGIMAAHEVGISPLKLNVVIMRGVNDDEMEDLARLTLRYPFYVRFIEIMPFRQDNYDSVFVSSSEIIERLRRVAPFGDSCEDESNGPALYYRFKDAPGKIGIISPMSGHFCMSCNRVRVTSDGKLRTCLFALEERDLRLLLRSEASDTEIAAAIRTEIEKKPERHLLGNPVFRKCISRQMYTIGG
jgi:cyclic pyranopterin phosphate synthase